MPRHSSREPNTATTTESSAEHRRRLEALFSNGNTAALPSVPTRPAATQERVYASPRKSTGRAPSEYRLRLERLRAAREEEDIKEAADAFLAHHQLPDDPDILHKLLRHPSESVIREALGQISCLLMQDRLPGTLLLEDHLKGLDGRVTEEATKSYLEGIRAQLESKKKG